MALLYMVTFTINILQMLAYIPYMDPMGYGLYIQYYPDVCVHGGLHCRRKAGASKWTKSGPSGPSSSSCLLFRGPKNGAQNRPQKRGRNIAGRRKGFQNGGPVSGTRVLHTQSAPLCVQWVAEIPEHFVCFPGNGLDKASSKFHSIYIYGLNYLVVNYPGIVEVGARSP